MLEMSVLPTNFHSLVLDTSAEHNPGLSMEVEASERFVGLSVEGVEMTDLDKS